MIVEGQRVAYVDVTFGDIAPVDEEGRQGRVLLVQGRTAHVQWDGGIGVDPVDVDDLLPVKQASKVQALAHPDPDLSGQFDEWFEDDTSMQVRAAYAEGGVDGMVGVLEAAGHLSMLSDYVEEAVGQISTRLRHDPNFAPVLAELADDEADSLLTRVATLALTGRTGADEE